MNIIPIKLSVTNCYLIKSGAKYILIDTGYEYEWDLFCKKIAQAGISIDEISHIILTHHDDDHSGLLNMIIKENNNIRVVMSHLAIDFLAKGVNDRTHGGGFVNRWISYIIKLKMLYVSVILKKRLDKKKNLTFPKYFARKDDIIIKGETLLKDIGINLDGRIIETPGHTVDSISVIFDDGDCIVGDAAANMLKFVGTNYCVIRIMDIDEYYISWNKIILKKGKRIFPSHGVAFSVQKLKENIYKNKKENIVLSN